MPLIFWRKKHKRALRIAVRHAIREGLASDGIWPPGPSTNESLVEVGRRLKIQEARDYGS